MRAELETLRAVFANAQLRRLELAWLATSLGGWGGALALSLYAYGHGGAAAVGVIALVRTLPGALVAPLHAGLADRLPRRTIMLGSGAVQGFALLAVAAAAHAGAAVALVDALVVVLAVAAPAYRPAFVALVPRVARTPAELASTGVATSIVSNVGFLVGSLAAGVLARATSVPAALAVLGGAMTLAVVPLLLVEADVPPERLEAESPRAQLTAGMAAVARDHHLRELVGLSTVLVLVDGALDVLVVVAALGFLGVGEAGAGLLNSAWGIGCVAGGAGVLALLGRGRLTAGLTGGALVLGVALEAFAAAPWALIAAVALLVYGAGYTLVEVAADTLLQRLTPDHVLGRVAGVVETLSVVALALGSLGAGLLAGAVGPRVAIAVAGGLVPAVVLLRRARLARLEAGAPVAEREYRLLREHPIFAPLPVAQAEYLARALTEIRVGAGETVIAEGEHGDRFYLIAEGRLDAEPAGGQLRTMTRGDGFGEIALLRDVPRTATVTAATPAVLLMLDRDTFLEAVATQPYSGRAARRVADERLAATP